jgi:hypothetical protein
MQISPRARTTRLSSPALLSRLLPFLRARLSTTVADERSRSWLSGNLPWPHLATGILASASGAGPSVARCAETTASHRIASLDDPCITFIARLLPSSRYPASFLSAFATVGSIALSIASILRTDRRTVAAARSLAEGSGKARVPVLSSLPPPSPCPPPPSLSLSLTHSLSLFREGRASDVKPARDGNWSTLLGKVAQRH